jgi:hypothetical protein
MSGAAPVRSVTTLGWAAGTGSLGACALVVFATAFNALLDLVGAALRVFTDVPPTDTSRIVVVAATAVCLCMAISLGGGWVLAGAPAGLVPGWLAGLVAGLLGVGAGVVVMSTGLGLAPF